MPGQTLRTGIVSVADETCAILAFGGALAALTHARATGIGQKVDCSLLGGQIRLMGWTLTTAMWRNRDPVTGQARITGTPERPGISASFNDRDGKPLVFQLNGERPWRDGDGGARAFTRRWRRRGSAISASSSPRRAARRRCCASSTSSSRPGSRDDWVERLREADIVSAPINTLLEASNDPDVVANGYVAEVEYPKHGKRLKVHGSPWHFSETPAEDRHRPRARRATTMGCSAALGYSPADIARPARAQDHLITKPVIPAKAGNHLSAARAFEPWVPAFAGMVVLLLTAGLGWPGRMP